MNKDAQKIVEIELSELLLRDLEKISLEDKKTTGETINFILKQYVSERQRIELKSQMKKGYLEMGDINLDIASDSLLSDESALNIYEEFLSECEESDS